MRNIPRLIATTREVTSQNIQFHYTQPHFSALRFFCRIAATCVLRHSFCFTQPDASSALAVDYLRVSMLKTSRAFSGEGFLSPNHAGGKSSIVLPYFILVFALKSHRVDILAMYEGYLLPSSPHGNHLSHILFIVHVRSFVW